MKKDKDFKELIIEKLKQSPIVQIVCERIGIGRASYYRWRKEDPKFKKATDEAITEGLLLVNDLAESQLISAIKDRNLSAIVFWLKNHHKTYTNKLEITGHLEHSKKELTPEEKALIKKALRLALPPAEQHEEKKKTKS